MGSKPQGARGNGKGGGKGQGTLRGPEQNRAKHRTHADVDPSGSRAVRRANRGGGIGPTLERNVV